MPVDFLTNEQKSSYGQFQGEPNDVQLARYFHLDEADLVFIRMRRGEHNRFGVALQLGCARFLGTFLTDLTQVPKNTQRFVARQLGITNIAILNDYAHRETTRREHASLIRTQYHYREFSWPWSFRLIRLLYTRSWISNERPSLLFDLATGWLIQHKILLPGASTLTRLISQIRERSENRLWERLAALPDCEQGEQLDCLLQLSDTSRTTHFDRYRKGPVNISSPAFNESVGRYKALKSFGIQSLDFTGIPPIRFKHIARYAGMISAYKIARMPTNKRKAILVAFVKAYEIIALDEALDVLDMLITQIAGEAKKLGQKKRLRTLKDLDKSALTLANVCVLLLNDTVEDEDLRSAIFQKLSRESLEKSITTIKELARPYDDNFHEEMVEQYGRVRRFLPSLFKDIDFEAAPAGVMTLEAHDYLSQLLDSRKQILDGAPMDIVSNPWKRLVMDKEGRVNKRGYTLCFLDKLQDSLRRRDIFVANSDRWGDPRAKLLQGHEWQINRIQVCRSLGHPINPKEAITALTQQLDATYRQVSEHFDDNQAVKIDDSGKRPTLTITHIDKLDNPPSLQHLSKQIEALLPRVDLTELLLEINAHTGFADEFTHISESNARANDITVSICAVLLAEACNIGLEPLIKSHVPALTRHRLSWVKQNYLRAETLVKANAKLVDYQSSLSLAHQWGGGEVASADGMRFVTPTRTINSGANRKYFGSSRGITWYNFVSDQFSGFHGIVIPGTLRDSIFVLEGLLEQQTGLNPVEIMTDTAGSSDLVFGLFWLLGYQFSPRLADAGESVFWRVDKEANYGALEELARSCVNTHKIEQHWDDMMRIAGSLKLGTVQASELIRSLLKSDRPSSLAQAIIEAGRINKTLYLLNYIDDEDYRRRILTQLNRGESRHAVARAICHGQRGEIRKRYREGQEDQLGSLGLVTNAVVLWNTIYMQAAITHLEIQGADLKDEDMARLSPLSYKHVNMLGHYSFTLAEQVINGELRPLKQPTDQEDFA
ncbi:MULTISPECIES: Tn3 family transposase [Vibrio]|jgi:TnpA family transposase|uniref:Tn3 family transposase n=1 Tax=Vibrio TaxID=662 RepID=UPI0012684599|nr:Tn3 family transposase [Vibrio sp. THAF190c]QFT09991.1 Tn3 transposase DDE domain protein [Vibrio sp. THAF190c]QFT13477.1 Tn3 transposase DDE domain protein [Vibrio sp. THAF190c]QFT13569.1 Tn3 transposase DDE domain protein [Vibrio sp. THAF190c]QFT13630.1 Tn3 transposase DDE domain protein [Vibrio sp. THAF190c]